MPETRSPKIVRARRWTAGALVLAIAALCGCRTATFYSQAIKGQYEVLRLEQPTRDLLADPHTPAPLRERLALLNELRAFAESELRLKVDGHYTKYADLHRPYVVWNVKAAPEFSLQPKTWWYPLVGRLAYRGYFEPRLATNYAAYLRGKGFDVSVGGSQAYSTLGWFKDPALNTFLFDPRPELAEIIFHELAHQRVFVAGDTDFNEAFATTVGEEGARRWLQTSGGLPLQERYLARLEHTRQFVGLVMQTRSRLEELYGDSRDNEGKIQATDKNKDVAPEWLRERKAEILQEFQLGFAAARSQWDGDEQYQSWLSLPLNNAHLNAVAAYYELVPGFEEMLRRSGGNLETFYRAVEQLGKKSKAERRLWLRSLGKRRPPERPSPPLSLRSQTPTPGDAQASPARARGPETAGSIPGRARRNPVSSGSRTSPQIGPPAPGPCPARSVARAGPRRPGGRG